MPEPASSPIARPRLQIEAVLHERGLTAAQMALAAQVPEPVVQALLQGDVPAEPAALARLGRAIGVSGAEAEAWAWALSAGICQLAIEDARVSLRGRLWQRLILHEESIAACA